LIKRFLKTCIEYALAAGYFPGLYFTARAEAKQGRRQSPRIAWGPTPLKPISYNSKALRSAGFDSYTVVDAVFAINSTSDFDELVFGENGYQGFLKDIRTRLRYFKKFLKNYDIFITNFDGGILRGTKLRFFENFFLKTAGRKIIVWPYGGDSYVYSLMIDHTFRYGLTQSYPELAKNDPDALKRIYHFSKYADFIVGNIPHNEACPKSDILTVACYGVDTEEWRAPADFRHINDGTPGKTVKIIHAPNHPAVKGTNFIVAAVEQLKAEGLDVELEIVRNVKHDVLRDKMKNCDIIAAQCLYGYASTEIEGMSLSKPVITNMENGGYYDAARNYTYVRNCPLVSAAPDQVAAKLRELVKNPQLRYEIALKGRDYVEKYHSLAGQGALWGAIIRKVWEGSQENIDDWWLQR
jgi:glycosyltransferase involved in cell wall biosynthesis